MASEHLSNSGERQTQNPEAIRQSQEQAERLKNLHETAAEKERAERNPEQERQNAEREAKEQADSKEQVRVGRPEKEAAPERRGAPSKQERAKAFDATMENVRKDMSLPQKTFSKLIHNRSVEVASEAIGSTVARPNVILAASASALLFTTVAYVVARYYGYVLSGFESIATFAIGWVVGILFEYFRAGVFNRKKR